MFCSNCGKEIEDGSAFCSGCGKAADKGQPVSATVQQAVYIDQVKNNIIVGTAEEVKKKMAVLGMYVAGTLMQIFLFLVVLTSKFGVLAEFIVIENPMTVNIFENEVKQSFEKNQGIIWFGFIFISICMVFYGFILWRDCVNRCLANNRKEIIVDCVVTAIWCFGVTVVLINVCSFYEFGLSFLYWIVLFGIIICKAIYSIIYLNAINLEIINVYREKTRAYSVNN